MTVLDPKTGKPLREPHDFTSLKIRRISGVDRPAQGSAKAVLLMKRADEAADHEATKTTELAAPKASLEQTGEPMSNTEPKAAELEKRIADLESQLTTATARAAMTDAEKAHLATLKGADAEAFLKDKPEARAAKVEAAKAADAVVYKAADGTEYRRSDDQRLVAMAQRADKLDADAKKAREEREIEVLKARAKAEIPHLPGDEAVHVALLKAVDGISDEKLRTGALAAIKANDAGLGAAFKRSGVNGAPNDSAGPEAKLEAMARKRATDAGITFEKAYAEASDTPEGRQLLSEAMAAHAEAGAV